MSRIRTTLDSVTKAVGSTDLISRFSRLKPGSAAVDSTHVEKVVKAETLTSNGTAASPPPENTMKEDEGEKNTAEENLDKQQQQITEKPFIATKKSTSSLTSATNVSAPISSSTMAKQTMQLFHPAGSTNMDETYKTLAQHINSYFGTNTQGEEGDNRPQEQKEGDVPVSEPILHTAPLKNADHIPILSPVAKAKSSEEPTTSPAALPSSPSPLEQLTPPEEMPSSDTSATENTAPSVPVPTTTTPKKGFTHYLSYPRPSVQAFVGSYIAPLVPKFRGDSKSIAAEKDKSLAATVEESTVEKTVEKRDSEAEKEEKAKQQLLAQREKVWLQ